jgi:hypothetical protein
MFEQCRIRAATPVDAEPLAALAERTFRDTFANDTRLARMSATPTPRRMALWSKRWRFETVGDHEFRLGADDQTDLIMARPVVDAA